MPIHEKILFTMFFIGLLLSVVAGIIYVLTNRYNKVFNILIYMILPLLWIPTFYAAIRGIYMGFKLLIRIWS